VQAAVSPAQGHKGKQSVTGSNGVIQDTGRFFQEALLSQVVNRWQREPNELLRLVPERNAAG